MLPSSCWPAAADRQTVIIIITKCVLLKESGEQFDRLCYYCCVLWKFIVPSKKEEEEEEAVCWYWLSQCSKWRGKTVASIIVFIFNNNDDMSIMLKSQVKIPPIVVSVIVVVVVVVFSRWCCRLSLLCYSSRERDECLLNSFFKTLWLYLYILSSRRHSRKFKIRQIESKHT